MRSRSASLREAGLEMIDVEGGVVRRGSCDHRRGQEGVAQLLAPPLPPLQSFAIVRLTPRTNDAI